MCTLPVLRRFARESYNQPEEVYELLKRRGMNLVTVTDHDSIDAVESLRGRSDFFVSEEVSCRMPSGTRVHVGVYDLEDRDHVAVQKRRNDMEALAAYLRERRLLFGINHIFSSLTGRREGQDFHMIEALFPAVETRNGQMLERANNASEDWARRAGKIAVAGSDAHALVAPGKTYTEITGARTKREFLEGLRQGRGRVRGEMGSPWKLTREVASIGWSVLREHPAWLPLAPLLAAVPLFVLGNALAEMAFARRWTRRLRQDARTGGRFARPLAPSGVWEMAG
jgi:predicted metal-dependent phosphoesterase TrpH